MYVPRSNRLLDDDAHALVRATGAADLITVGADAVPHATRVPVLVDRDAGVLLAHLARANPHWTSVTSGSAALAIVTGPDAYVSPGWYASKAEHGRVVPTWNYSAVHLRGSIRIVDDLDWVLDVVTRQTQLNEDHRERAWQVTDAPPRFLREQLHGIVGVELTLTSVEGKAKFSQNRSQADRDGVVVGLRDEPDPRSHAVAEKVRDPMN